MIMDNRRFWIRYLGEGTDLTGQPLGDEYFRCWDDPFENVKITFAERYTLEIEIDGGHRLRLCDAFSNEEILLGWMDPHHMSDAFRYEELEAICAASTTTPRWQVRALLSHYVAPMPGNIESLVASFRSALLESQLFTDTEVAIFANFQCAVGREGFRWIEDAERGWLGVEDGGPYPWMAGYTLRSLNNDEFNFGMLRRFLTYCHQFIGHRQHADESGRGDRIEPTPLPHHPA